MGRSEEYRAALRATPADGWDAWLAARSGLPGPRANLELAQVVADEAPSATLRRYAGAGDDYLALCGAVGLGRLLAQGDPRAAGVCEPRLLRQPGPATRALGLLDQVTGSLATRPPGERADPAARALRQALGYCWSVAVAALPAEGFARLERWAAADDPDVRWLVRENLRKSRMRRADPERWARLCELAGLEPEGASRRGPARRS
jgi:hypothetical protein